MYMYMYMYIHNVMCVHVHVHVLCTTINMHFHVLYDKIFVSASGALPSAYKNKLSQILAYWE